MLFAGLTDHDKVVDTDSIGFTIITQINPEIDLIAKKFVSLDPWLLPLLFSNDVCYS